MKTVAKWSIMNLVRNVVEGSWYEGGNPHKDDAQETYVPGLDD
jgi:hypothetical protein